MKNIIIPPSECYSNASDFFAMFVKTNKEGNSNFSYRFVASKLKWPIGYIPDVIAGRKAFTLLRALQFADYYKLRSVDKERLTWFALVESDNEEVKSFFLKKLHLKPQDVLRAPIALKCPDLYNTTSALCAFLILKKRRMTSSQIIEQMRLPYLTEKKVLESLDEIEKNRYLVWDSAGELIENNANFTFDNYCEVDGKPFVNIGLHREPTESFLKFIESPRGPVTYHSGIIQVRKDQFMSLALQIISLRNWLLEVSDENVRTATVEDTHRLMQFDLNLFPVTEIG